MCFSATASFTASVVIGGVAAACLVRAKTVPQYAIAAIPVCFAVQQAFEGLMWVSLCHPDYAQWQGVAKNGFLSFATVVWPILVPLVAWLLERPGLRKNLFGLGLALGLGVGGYFVWGMIHYPILPYILKNHIRYEFRFPGYRNNLITALYFAAAVVPPLFSSVRAYRWFGVMLLVSLIFAAIFYMGIFLSVWCFFAAVLSAMCWWMIGRMNQVVSQERFPHPAVLQSND